MRSVKRITTVLGASVACAVLARVIIDGLRDPTSHNLWPFEVMIALALGLPLALAGSLAGAVIAKVFALRRRERRALLSLVRWWPIRDR